MPRDTLTAADHAWLELEDPDHPMVATAAFLCRGAVGFDCLKERIEDRLMALGRFRQRVVQSRIPLARPFWREVDDFELRHHLVREELAAPADREALVALAERLMERPLERSHPLWRVHWVESVDRGSALVVRVHHSLADLFALPAILELLIEGPGRSPAVAAPETPIPAGRVREVAALHGASARTLARLITMRSDRSGLRSGARRAGLRAAWGPLVARHDLRALGRRLQAGEQELLLAAAAGALGRVLAAREGGRRPRDPRALLASDLRAATDSPLASRIGLTPILLPAGDPAPAARLRAVRSRLQEVARAPESVVAIGGGGEGLTMSELEERSLKLASDKASVLVALLPGVAASSRLCGRPVEGVMYWPPLAGALSIGISLVTQGPEIHLGVVTDADRLADPSELLEAFRTAIDEMGAPSQQGGAPGPGEPHGVE